MLRPGSGLSARRALALIRQLPMESATVANLRGGPEFRDWGTTQYLLADVLDSLAFNTYATVSAAGPKNKPKAPQPYPRPESRAQRKRGQNSFAAMAARRIAAAKRRNGEVEDGEGRGH